MLTKNVTSSAKRGLIEEKTVLSKLTVFTRLCWYLQLILHTEWYMFSVHV